MPATDRLRHEQLFHDRQALQRAAWFAERPQDYRVDAEAYLDHETWIRPAFEKLGDVRGLPVLDFGCGHAMAAVVLARRGARVSALDLSAGYLAEARRRAQASQVAVDFVHADGERLPFADAVFARVWGNAILHHLDLCRAGLELRRVLRPGGVAVFCEPWGENRLLNWARRRLAYREKARTADEQPLTEQHIDRLRSIFACVEVQGYQILSTLGRVWPGCPWRVQLQRQDYHLVRRFPQLQRLCRYVVITLRSR